MNYKNSFLVRLWAFFATVFMLAASFFLFGLLTTATIAYGVVPVSNSKEHHTLSSVRKIYLDETQPKRVKVFLLPKKSPLTRKFTHKVLKVPYSKILHSYRVAKNRGTGSKELLLVHSEREVKKAFRTRDHAYSYVSKRFQRENKRTLNIIN